MALTRNCDWCARFNLGQSLAVETVPLTINGKSVEVDVCAPHQQRIQEVEFVIEGLPAVETAEAPPAAPQDEAPVVMERIPTATREELATGEPPALEKTPEPLLEDSAAAPAQPTLPMQREEAPPQEADSGVEGTVICAECDPPSEIGYRSRSGHARRVHGKKLEKTWWESGTLKLDHPCTVHKECLEVGLAYSTPQGLRQHTAGVSPPPGGIARTVTEAPPLAMVPTLPEPPEPKRKTPAGSKKEGVDQVICPLNHQNKKKPFYVDVPARGSHADRCHHGIVWYEIPWEIPSDVSLAWVCQETTRGHEKCAAGHARFTAEKGLHAHITGISNRFLEKTLATA